jgi:hypothetical protein
VARERTYTDERLVIAIATSRSWRQTLRELGLAATSAGAMRSLRSHADRLGLDYSHFTRSPRLTEDRLKAAVAVSREWPDVVRKLQIDGVSAVTAAKGHAARFGIDVSHLESRSTVEVSAPRPEAANLSRAGSLLAASWFTLCGLHVAWPLEPARYDLLVDTGNGTRRVQVKTTTSRAGVTWKVYLSTSRGQRRTYDPDEIDDFFVIDGSFAYYLIPVAVVGGLQAIHLSSYDRYRLPALPSPVERGANGPR